MRFLITLLTMLFLCSYSAEMLDADYNFIEHAFEGSKAVSERDFQKAINSKTLEDPPTTLGGKIRTFLFGRRYKTDAPIPVQTETPEPVSDAQLIKDIKNGIYYIKLIAPVIGMNNKVIPAGNYKIKEEKINEQSVLAFYQGREEYGTLKLYRYDDTLKKEQDLTYSRVDIVSDDTIRIIYSTIEDTKCAVAKVYTP